MKSRDNDRGEAGHQTYERKFWRLVARYNMQCCIAKEACEMLRDVQEMLDAGNVDGAKKSLEDFFRE